MSTLALSTAARARSSAYAGTGQLLALAWRRDRVLIPASILGLAALSVGSAKATLELYPDLDSAQQGLGSVLLNPAVQALYGPVVATSIDGLAVFKTVMLGAVFTAILGFVVTRRHTRSEEEEGRLELLGAGVVGRRAPLTAALLLALLAVLGAGALSTLGLLGLGMEPVGSLAFGSAWLTAGVSAIGLTALAAQLAATARGCGGLVLGSLGIDFLLRAVGDTATSPAGQALGWLTPLGWAGRTEPYGANRFFTLGLGVALAAGATAIAYRLLATRDLGSGILPSRRGLAEASRVLRSPAALVGRLTRGSVLGWLVGVAVVAAVVGSLLASVTEMAADPAVRAMLERVGGAAGSIEDIFVSTELRFIAGAVTAAGVALVLRLAGAERGGAAEVVLATPTRRSSWYAAHVGAGFTLTAVLLAAVGTLIGAVGHRVTPQAPTVAEGLGAALALVPGVWVVVGAAAALFGLGARYAAWSWGVLLVGFLLGEVGRTMGLPEWVISLSPFAHTSHLPGGRFDLTPTLLLLSVAAALVGFGLLAYQRRDAA